MKNAFRISVNSPCSENFDKFEKTATGGFCNSCQNDVIDFTHMNDSMIFDFFQNSSNTRCGRFHTSQLKTYEPINFNKMNNLSFPKHLATLGFSLLSLCAVSNLQSQEIAMGEPIVQTELDVNSKASVTLNQQQEYTIKGTVLDEANLPLPGASVVLKGTKLGVATDFDGKFEFPQALKANEVLIFSYVGYGRKEYTVVANENEVVDITINFTNDDLVLMGDVIVGGIHKTKRNFFQRIGDMFR